jgi:transposase
MMGTITTIGLDIAKSVFQVHGIGAAGEVIVRKQLSRARVLSFFEKLPPCLIGIEACNTSHYWARELIARGHDVRLMPAQYVKPYVKRGKNDSADAEAICEAVTRPTMRFVAVKTPEQQSVMMLHRVRLMLNRQRTQLSNAMRAHMSEFGVVAPVGRMGLERLLAIVTDRDDLRIPADARVCLEMLAAQLAVVKEQRSYRTTGASGQARGRLRSAAVSWTSPVSARCLPVRSWRALLILACSERVVTWPHGSALYPSKTRAAARSVSAASHERATATFDRCW